MRAFYSGPHEHTRITQTERHTRTTERTQTNRQNTATQSIGYFSLRIIKVSLRHVKSRLVYTVSFTYFAFRETRQIVKNNTSYHQICYFKSSNPNAPKSVFGWGSFPRPSSRKE